MDQAVRFDAGGALGDADPGPLGHPDLAVFDATRGLFVETGLSPEPPAYELFWLHLKGLDPALSRDLTRAMEGDGLTEREVIELRRTHLGEIAAGEMHDLVATAHGAAVRLAERLQGSHEEIALHDRTLVQEDDLLADGSVSAIEIAACIKRLRAANARMLAANRRLESDLQQVSRENAALIDRLESAERKAKTDTLTGLLNRRGLNDALARALLAARETGAPLSVALIHLDNFGQINEQWGHAIGDEVLRYLGTFLSHCLKKAEGSFAGRYGGVEFLLVLPGMAMATACRAMESIRAALARQVMRRASDGARLGKVTFSAGISQARRDDDAEALIDRADSAAYTARRAGGDRVLPERPDLN